MLEHDSMHAIINNLTSKEYERRLISAEAGGLGRLDPGPETRESKLTLPRPLPARTIRKGVQTAPFFLGRRQGEPRGGGGGGGRYLAEAVLH